MIIFINGSINSGKSTIAKLLAESLGNTANIEVDKIRNFVDFMPLEQSIPINLKNTVDLIKNFVENGLNVVIPYPLSQKNYEYFVDKLKDIDTKIWVFTLAPKLEKVLLNRGNRELDEWEISRIKHHYEVGIHNPSFGEIIDNSDQLPEETTKIILDIINK
jgi:hypothetical protein